MRVKKRTESGKVVKRNGKVVFVKKKKCKPKPKAKPTPAPTPPPAAPIAPTPAPPAPSTPSIQVLGWSTQAVDAGTPADTVPNGSTITTCTNPNGLSVYVRRTGVTSVGQLTYAWTRDGAAGPTGANTTTPDGTVRRTVTGSPLQDETYVITWSAGGTSIASASVTRDCVP